MRIYAEMGGQSKSPRLRPGAWDLAYEDGLVVELDEELHFNRYRGSTLVHDWCAKLPWREDYLEMCQALEGECVRAGMWGKRWTSTSTEGMFGPADPAGQLDAGGAPRWKQRALYDAMKDMWSLSGNGIRLARVAVYDTVADAPMHDVLDGSAAVPGQDLLALIDRRTAGT